MRGFLHAAVVAGLGLGITACQTTEPRWAPKGQSASFVSQMHPDIQGPFGNDYIQVIVKGTSAQAMQQACPRFVRVRPAYQQSLALTLRSNDIEFGPGSSRKEVAAKVRDHKKSRDCASLAEDLNKPTGYDNLFLEKI